MTKSLLRIDEESVYSQLEKEFGKNRSDVDEDVEIICEWLKTQQHLPRIIDRQLVKSFILLNKFSIEKTKQKLDLYFSIRIQIPEFGRRHPCSSEMIQLSRLLYIIPLPKQAADNRKVIVGKFTENLSSDLFSHELFMCHLFNVWELLMREGLFMGTHFIFDCEGFKIGHALKLNPLIFRKTAVILQKVFSNRMASLHYVNFHSALETPLKLLKMALPEKLKQRVYVQKSMDDLLVTFPRAILPSDLGGDEPPLADMAETLIRHFEDKKEIFDQIIDIKVDELKRIELINDELLGFHGNFKKLEID